MKCPVCSDSSLHITSLESRLNASCCSDCQGQWISANDYWTWLKHHGETLPEKEPDELPIQADDVQRAKLCPECKRIMLRYKVGHSLDFRLDQCGSCNGVWFDANEWEALKQRNLHDEVHLIFSAPWQSQVRKDEARKLLEAIYTEAFSDDYGKIKEIKSWIENHPEQEKILNYLSNEDPYEIGASNSAN
ncbi:TFIIB-type zinc ribbon-containing protein [Leptothoe spongobia]|uniref:Zf-TFIIB domain-containing protein n=1 Tax=Leptothoe spongobia TAU-MAC 1115 TaxID=1967444 RepID=A0A947GKA6_9CYAN|nr:zf-TFIIB domain-containing protein [Leptothoe spongobia]MBT9313886.1 zf-TFIIB domain-containing protein [Leptothoe spongobia TAU-MAC 1115]